MKGLLLTIALLQGSGSIDGTVTNKESGSPLQHTKVMITRVDGQLSDVQVGSTDDSGKFHFGNVPAGSYRVFSERSGFARAEYGQPGPGKAGAAVDIPAGKSVSGIDVSMVAESAITGRVIGPASEPVSRATVRVLKSVYKDGQRTFEAIQSAESNDLGEYRLFGLTPGSWVVSLTPPPSPYLQGTTLNTPAGIGIAGTSLQPLLASGAMIDPRALDGGIDTVVYLPGTTDPAAALPIPIAPGSVARLPDLRIVRGRGSAVLGQVIDSSTGQPPPTAVVSIYNSNGTFSEGPARSQILMQGRPFEFGGMPPGVYGIVATNGGPAMQASTLVTVGNEEVTNLRIILRPVFEIKGRIKMEGSVRDIPKIRVQFRSATGATAPTGTPTAEGILNLTRASTGDFRLSVLDLPPNLYIKSARLGTRDALNSLVHFEEGSPDEFEIVVAEGVGSLNATVVDANSKPVTASTVALVPDAAHQQRFDLYRTAVSDASGRISIAGIAPGNYKMYAWTDIDINAWQSPQVMREYEGRGLPVSISENGSETVTVKVIE